MDTEPVDPELDVPELNASRPDVPVVPAFALRSVTEPLVVAVLAPLTISRWPPVTLPPKPDAISSWPPCPPVVLLPVPADRDTEPPAALVMEVAPEESAKSPPANEPEPVPGETFRDPPAPFTAVPEPMDTVPVVPELDVPELNTSRPDVPAVPAFADLIVSAPLVVAVLKPEKTRKRPPVDFAPRPDDT
jgi:hypothetical protein